MTTRRRIAVISVIAVALTLLIAGIIAVNFFRRQHTVFDSQKWKTDITSRYDMPEPARPGMHKGEILSLLGKPDALAASEAGSNENSSLIYLMPTASKGIYCVYFKNDVVTSTYYDDSGDDSYPTKK